MRCRWRRQHSQSFVYFGRIFSDGGVNKDSFWIQLKNLMFPADVWSFKYYFRCQTSTEVWLKKIFLWQWNWKKSITKQQGKPQNVASVFLNKYYKTSIISVDFLLGCLARGCLKRNPTWAFDDIGSGSLAVLLTHWWRHINKPTSKFHHEPTCLWERGLYYISPFKTTHVITPKTKAVTFQLSPGNMWHSVF